MCRNYLFLNIILSYLVLLLRLPFHSLDLRSQNCPVYSDGQWQVKLEPSPIGMQVPPCLQGPDKQAENNLHKIDKCLF